MDKEADNDDVNAAEIEYDITENELEDYIFNSEITNEDILKSAQDLRRGKSAGPDDLIPEFFINSIDNIIPLLNKFFNRIFDHVDYPEPWSYSIIVLLIIIICCHCSWMLCRVAAVKSLPTLIYSADYISFWSFEIMEYILRARNWSYV